MVDFIDSFNQGITAAQKATANMDEIDEVINSLSKQLNTASGGRINVYIIQKSSPLSELFGKMDKALGNKPRYAIVATNPQAEFNPQELAEWKFDENGYPCRMITSEQELYCEDKEALEIALSNLLSTPAIGKKLKSVMDQKPQA